MDKELIERLAREAGGYIETADNPLMPLGGAEFGPDELRRFAALVAEECAKECERWSSCAALFAASRIRERFKP